MKTLSGTLRVVALVGLGLATVITLRALAQTPKPATDPDVDKLVLKIAKNPNEYYSLKGTTRKAEADFIALMCDANRSYDKPRKLHFKSMFATKEFDLPGDCETARSAIPSGAQLNIKTDKVTVSKAAQSIADDELAVIGPHVTIQVASKSPDDIKAVLDSLAPSP